MNVFREMKYGYQRIKRGYSDRDVWNIDNWFLEVVPKMLKDFKGLRTGHPFGTTSEEYDAIIDRIIYCFEELDEDDCSVQNEVEWGLFTNSDSEEYRERWCKRQSQVTTYRNDRKNEAFNLLKKYFHSFWW